MPSRTRHTVLLIVVTVLIITAGCSSLSPTDTTPETESSSEGETPEPQVPNSTSDTNTTQSGTDSSSQSDGRVATVIRVATVTRVVDGDTVEVRFQDGTEDTIRLLGVDTPETTYSRVSPDEYAGIPNTTSGRDHLFNWGENAKEYAVSTLSNKQVTIVTDDESDTRGYYGRLLAYVMVDGENFNALLLENGYARVYESDFTKLNEFNGLQETAQTRNVGVWDYTTPDTSQNNGNSDAQLSIPTIHADAAGNDNENLNDEYIVVKNTGSESVRMGGWTVRDAAGYTYTIPSGVSLPSDGTITIHTGSGSDTGTDLYMGASRAVWNNGGDDIIIRDKTGTVLIQESY